MIRLIIGKLRLRIEPFPPVRRAYIDPVLRLCFDPSAENTTAWKGESVRPIVADHGQFKVAIKRRSRYRLPVHKPSLFGNRLRMSFFCLD
jgi:hypothetical protein